MYDFDTICRTCFSSDDELHPLFDNFQLNITEILIDIVDIKVIENDNYPKNICINCLDKLYSAYNFKQQCHETQQKLKEYLNNFKNKVDLNITHEKKNLIASQSYEFLIDNASEENDFDVKKDIKEDEPKKIGNKNVQERETSEIENKNVIAKDDMKNIYNEENENLIEDMKSETKEESTCQDYEFLIENASEENKDKPKKIRNKNVRRKGTCEICNETVTKLFEHMRKHTKEKPFKCETCDKRFSLGSNYNRHLRIHRGEKPFGCDICKRIFTQKHTLKTHLCMGEKRKPRTPRRSGDPKLPVTKEQIKSFECNFCGKGFVFRQSLDAHIVVHTGERPFKCTLCEKTFAYRGGLKVHELTSHTDEKHFKCSFCDKQFHVRAHCVSHERTHTGEKQYKCSYCEREFIHQSSLKSHLLIHTSEKPFQCQICTRTFRQQQQLTGHLRTHTGVKPYKCQYCDHQFALKGNLTVHERIHTGDRPYKCTLCSQEFYRSRSLKKHIEKHGVLKMVDNCVQNDNTVSYPESSEKIIKTE